MIFDDLIIYYKYFKKINHINFKIFLNLSIFFIFYKYLEIIVYDISCVFENGSEIKRL